MCPMTDCPWLERQEAQGIARLITERKRTDVEFRPIEELVRLFGLDELLRDDELAGEQTGQNADGDFNSERRLSDSATA
jgi:hypothetical protein